MNLLYFTLFSFSIFLTSLIGGKKYRNTTLYALAIGGVVNANFFHAGNYPIDCFGLPFGIDSIIYTLFIFCVIVMLIKESKKAAYLLAISSIIAIFFSALMQLSADLLSKGSSLETWTTFLSFSISCIASLIAVSIMLEILDKIKSKVNNYLLLVIGIVVASIINTTIYYPLMILISGVPENILTLLLTSLLGKLLALISSLVTLLLLNQYDKKHIIKKV